MKLDKGYEEVQDGPSTFVNDRVDVCDRPGSAGFLSHVRRRISDFFSEEANITYPAGSQESNRTFFGASAKEWLLFVVRGLRSGLMGILLAPAKICGVFVVDKSDKKVFDSERGLYNYTMS